MKRRLLLGALFAVVLGLTGMTAAPAGAATAGAGAVTGTVNVTPGIDLTAKATSYTFTPITIAGSVGGCTGTFTTTTVSGGSASESTVSASGTVGPFAFSGSGVNCTVSGTATGGSFVRVGATVTVIIDATVEVCITVNTTTICVKTVIDIFVHALFVVTAGNGVTVPATQATFAGAFALAGA